MTKNSFAAEVTFKETYYWDSNGKRRENIERKKFKREPYCLASKLFLTED